MNSVKRGMWSSALVLTMLGGLQLTQLGCHSPAKQNVAESTPNPGAAITPVAPTPAPTASTPSGPLSFAAGTSILVEMAQVLDSERGFWSDFTMATVIEDVKDTKGAVAIPANSQALLVIREGGRQGTKSVLTLGLNRIQVGNRTVKVAGGASDLATVTLVEDSKGEPMHRSVHLSLHSQLPFKLEKALEIK